MEMLHVFSTHIAKTLITAYAGRGTKRLSVPFLISYLKGIELKTRLHRKKSGRSQDQGILKNVYLRTIDPFQHTSMSRLHKVIFSNFLPDSYQAM